jgi:UDP-N-acetyl-2-amino-2-deoxyglucuronate dehydrogenase
MHEPIRLGIVGTGQISRQSHLPAALACDQVRVAALVDSDPTRAADVARSFGIRPQIANRLDDVLGTIDAAIIATPNAAHRSLAVACLEAGVSTLIEKPLASTYTDGEQIVAAAEKNAATLAVGYCLRYRSNVLLLKELLDSGYFGRLQRFVHQAGTSGGWAPLSAYHLDRTSTGGGVLVVTGSHFLDRLLYLWGFPDEAEFTDDSAGGPEANCRATFRFNHPQGAFEGCAVYSKTVPMPAMLVIETDRGLVLVGDSDNANIVFRPAEDPRMEVVVRPRGPVRQQDDVFRLQIEDFVDAHRNRRAPLVDGRQGLESLRLIEQLYAVRKPMRTDWYEGSCVVTRVPA